MFIIVADSLSVHKGKADMILVDYMITLYHMVKNDITLPPIHYKL